MDGSLVSFGHWLQNREFALAIAGSDWAYPFVQATHFTGLSLWVGTNVLVDHLAGSRKEIPESIATFKFIICVELDRVWNCRHRGVAALLRLGRDIPHQHCLSHKTRLADSSGSGSAHCDTAKSAGLGKIVGNPDGGKGRWVRRFVVVVECCDRSRSDPVCGLKGAFRRPPRCLDFAYILVPNSQVFSNIFGHHGNAFL